MSASLQRTIKLGDAYTELQKIAEDTIDLMVTDPPYGYQFMNKDWDKVVVGVETWKECLRVLKPGAFAFIMSSPRQDVLSRMIVNLQDAGFRTDFTSIYWTYASGFPKAKNLKDGSYTGFQPKPAVEVILVVMKQLSEKSFTDQALSNGKGVTWLDNCRIPYTDLGEMYQDRKGYSAGRNEGWKREAHKHYTPSSGNQKGRFPANLLVEDDVLNDGSYSRYFDLDKWYETTFPFAIIPKVSKSEKNKGLDKWIYPETEKPIVNNHPTVKPLRLMSWLITLGSRPNDLILDPFCGSGTTCIAAEQLQRRCIGIELNADYVTIALKRLEPYLNQQVRAFVRH